MALNKGFLLQKGNYFSFGSLNAFSYHSQLDTTGRRMFSLGTRSSSDKSPMPKALLA